MLAIFTWLALSDYLTLSIAISICSLTFTGILMIKKKEQVGVYLKSTQFRNLFHHCIQFFLIFCILGLINYLFYKNPFQWDLTAAQKNRLNQQSIELIKKVHLPVLFKVYMRKEDARRLLPLLELYRLENSFISFEVIDPEVNPIKVKEDKITKYGEVKIEFNGKSIRFFDYSEKTITNSLLKIMRENKNTIYFVKGHREPSIKDDQSHGISKLGEYLRSEGHQIAEIDLFAISHLEMDESILVIWGPKDGLLKEELAILKRFLKRKGSLFLALDPQINNGKDDPLASIRDLVAEERYITIANDLVVDNHSSIQGSRGIVPVIEIFDPDHILTKSMSGKVFFPMVSSIQFREAGDDKIIFSRLAATSKFPSSWAERDFDEVRNQKVAFTQGSDLIGPIVVMGASEMDGAKVLLVGNSSFVHNRYSDFLNSFILFSNGVNWLTDQGDLISFDRPSQQGSKLLLSAPAINVLFYFSVIFSPLILLTLAFVFYRYRLSS